jgi:hypothetical protein
MFTKTFERDGVKATVRGSTGRDLFVKRAMMRRMDVDPLDEVLWDATWEFVGIVSQSSDVVTPFAWPTTSASGEELNQAMDCWLALPEMTLRLWMNSASEVETPPIDPDLTPAIDPKNEPGQ